FNGEPTALGAHRQGEDVPEAVVARKLRWLHRTSEGHLMGDVKLLGTPLELLRVVAGADDHEVGVRNLSQDLRHRCHEGVLPFPGYHPADRDDDPLILYADSLALALTSRLIRGKTRGIDATGHGFPRRMGAEHSGNTATHITRDEGERVHVAANITEHTSGAGEHGPANLV